MSEFLSTIWDGIKFIFSWIIMIALLFGLIVFIISTIKRAWEIGKD